MIEVLINSVDMTNQIIAESLQIEQNLTSQIDVVSLSYRKYGSRSYVPEINDEIIILQDSVRVFAGKITKINETVESNADGLIFQIECSDYGHQLEWILFSGSFENQTVAYIINYIITNYAPGYTTFNVNSTFLIEKIVFNQVSIADCIKKLADILKYEWYVDYFFDVHFFSKFTENAPYNLTDISGNYIYQKLQREIDGTQIANQVKVRGGIGTENGIFTDTITVKGDATLTFKLPYKFANLGIRVDVGGGWVSKIVGIDNIDDFSTVDVLYNYQDDSIRFPTVFLDGDKIEFSGNKKYPILAIASDAESINTYGLREKIITENSIENQTLARRRAQAELEAYKDKISEIKFDTYTSGLRPGQSISYQSNLRNDDNKYIIKKVTAKICDPNNFIYSVELVTTRKYGLIELLMKLLEPDATPIDANEVAQIIKTDFVEIEIEEVIAAMNSINDFVEINITEEIEKDPLGAGVEPTWVLAKYVPTDFTDPKREGRLDISMTLY